MSSKELKNALKEAREAIKIKDFQQQYRNTILEEEGNHYMTLILLGAAYQDIDRPQAAKYLKQALNVADDPIIAIQGLANCVEVDELPEIYAKLLQLTPEKYQDIHQKLVNVSVKLKSPDACLEVLKKEINANQLDRSLSAYESIAQIAIRVTDFDNQWNELEKSKSLIKVLYKLKLFDKLMKCACDFIEIYPQDPIAYEWICKIYLDTIDDDSFDAQHHLKLPIDEYIKQLMSISKTAFVLLTNAVFLIKKKNEFVESRRLLVEANSLRPDWNVCVKYLALVNTKLRANSLAELFARQSKSSLLLIRCLIQQNIREKTAEAIELCKELLPNAAPNDKTELLELYSRGLLQNGDQLEIAMKIIEEIRSSKSPKYDLLLAIKYQLDGNLKEAIAKLTENGSDEFDSSEHHLLLCQCYFEEKKFELALTHCLKATQMEPYNSDCFFWLGKLYLTINDQIRAQKCFEKCVYLYPQHQQGVVLLSAMYRQSMNWNANNALLQSAANAVPGLQCKWARIQLGFHYLAAKNFNDAITAFRMALREDADDLSCWEGLADAYFQRGSYNSALKVYQKISELDPLNLHPKLQVANIKTTLKLHKDAVVCYKELLNEHPKFVPALSGMAEAHLGLCYYYLQQRLLGRCKSHAEQAVQYLIEALEIKKNFACLWRLLANVLQVIACLPKSKAFLTVPGFLVNVSEESVLLDGDKMFELSARLYCRALKIREFDAFLWYELGLSYYLRAIKYGNDTNREIFLKLAAETAKHTIKMAPLRWKNWNLLGIICTTKEINNLRLAQHCFIKALTIDKKSAVSWTNLGVLYLLQGQIKLANKSFGRSQRSDTGYINAWTGQAYIAERLGEDDEAMDLFKHSTSLGYTPESAIGFTHWVCSILNSEELMADKRFRYIIEKLHALPIALDSIQWFCDAEDDKATAESLCFLGYLNYHQCIWNKAIQAFAKAAEKTEGVMKDQIFTNLGYAYLKNNEPINAYEAFHAVTAATLKSTVGLALAHFKAEQYEESYSVYESALQWLANNDQEKAFILIAMAAMVYKFQGESDAKTLLFQCISLNNPPMEGLFSGCALGILHDDIQHETNSTFIHHIAFLTSQVHLKNGQVNKALIYLLSKVHIHPDNVMLRNVLANFLLSNYKTSQKYLIAASRIAQSTISLQFTSSKSVDSSMNAAKSLSVASEAMRRINQYRRKILAQNAVHINPTCKEAWGALISCLE